MHRPASINCSLFRSFRPNCNNTLFNAWDSLLNETESDATAHTDIAGVFGRAVSRPLLEKTFHMKIQSRTVFLHRESFETILDKTLTTQPTTCKGLFRPTVASVKKTVFTASTLNSFSLDFAFPFLDLITHCIWHKGRFLCIWCISNSYRYRRRYCNYG